MNAIKTVMIVHTRAELTNDQKAHIRTIARAGMELPTSVTESEFLALFNQAIASNINNGLDVWICKKSGKNALQITEDAVEAPEPISEPAIEAQVPDPIPIISNPAPFFEEPSDDDWDDDEDNEDSGSSEENIPSASTVPFCGNGDVQTPMIPTPIATVAPVLPVQTPAVAQTPIQPQQTQPKMDGDPVRTVYLSRANKPPMRVDMSEKMEKEIMFAILQNSTNNNLILKNFISNHMLESKISTRVVKKCLRHNKNQPPVTLTDAEREIVKEMKKRIIARMGLRLTIKGNGYTIPVQSMTEYGAAYYTELIYEESALRLPDGETPKYMFIINVADKSIMAKTLDGSKSWKRTFNDKTIAFINSRCNLKKYTRVAKPSVASTPSVDPCLGGDI